MRAMRAMRAIGRFYGFPMVLARIVATRPNSGQSPPPPKPNRGPVDDATSPRQIHQSHALRNRRLHRCCSHADERRPPRGQLAGTSSVNFDGVNDYITFGAAAGTAAPGLGVTNFTLELWFNWTGEE